MKPARVPQTVVAPDCWGDLPWGKLYRKALERQLNPWFTKMYGFHLLKIGNLSAEINCEACAVSHQVNVSAHTYRTQLLQSARKQLCGIRADVRNQKVDETAGSDVETKSWK